MIFLNVKGTEGSPFFASLIPPLLESSLSMFIYKNIIDVI